MAEPKDMYQCQMANCGCIYDPDRGDRKGKIKKAVFLGTETDAPKIYVTTPPDTPGKGYNFENMFRKMLELDADVLVQETCCDGSGRHSGSADACELSCC